MNSSKITTRKIVLTGLMAAVVCVVTFFRFPLLGSKVHFANAMCLLSGMLLGGTYGGIAAGLGSALYDGLAGGYDIVQCIITFVSKFLMAYVCGKIAWGGGSRAENKSRNFIASVTGALLYVALYMLKTFVYQKFVYGFPMETVTATMLSKLPASLINAVFAMIVAPILAMAVIPALKRTGMLESDNKR